MEESKIGKEKVQEIIKEAFKEQLAPKPEGLKQELQPKDWKDLQIKVKQIYLNLGCDTNEDFVVKGMRTEHRIDVFAVFNFGGQTYRTIIECKYWNSKVKKAQVGTSIGIIDDIGAEKGIIVSKKGFQSGARKLAMCTNISLTTYDELLRDSALFINKFKLENALKRLEKMETPFLKFHDLMKEEAEKISEWWYPTNEGYTLLGIISILKHKIESIDRKSYPASFIFGSLHRGKEVWKCAHNQSEYIDLILSNITTLELEFEALKDRIFAE